MIGCPIRYPLVTAYLFFILVSFWYGQSLVGVHSIPARESPGNLRSQGFPHAVSLAFHGGDKRDRTADLLNAIQALSQLSYTPILCLTGAEVILADALTFVKGFRQFYCKIFLRAGIHRPDTHTSHVRLILVLPHPFWRLCSPALSRPSPAFLLSRKIRLFSIFLLMARRLLW